MSNCKITFDKKVWVIVTSILLIAITALVVGVSARNAAYSRNTVVHMAHKYEVSPALTTTEEKTTAETWIPDETDVTMIAKALYGECRGVASTTEKAAVAWCILNRVDSNEYACGTSIEYVITFNHQFAYDTDFPVIDELRNIAYDVLVRYHNEKYGEENVGRVLPKEYIYFVGDGNRNYFSTEWKSSEYWDWSLTSPYED